MTNKSDIQYITFFDSMQKINSVRIIITKKIKNEFDANAYVIQKGHVLFEIPNVASINSPDAESALADTLTKVMATKIPVPTSVGWLIVNDMLNFDGLLKALDKSHFDFSGFTSF